MYPTRLRKQQNEFIIQLFNMHKLMLAWLIIAINIKYYTEGHWKWVHNNTETTEQIISIDNSDKYGRL